jgi:hypothetical protein
MIAIDHIEQRHRLLAQGMDDVTVVDDVAVLAVALRRPTAPQSQQMRGAEVAIEPIVELNVQAVADQPRRNTVEDPPQDEAAARRDQDPSLLIVGRSSIGQWLERSALDLDALAVPGVAPPDHLVNEATVGGEILELARAAQQQFVAKRLLEERVRGTRVHPGHHHARQRFIPARAGNATVSGSQKWIPTVHPRACGERLAAKAMRRLRFGSSPRVRGTLRCEPEKPRMGA